MSFNPRSSPLHSPDCDDASAEGCGVGDLSLAYANDSVGYRPSKEPRGTMVCMCVINQLGGGRCVETRRE